MSGVHAVLLAGSTLPLAAVAAPASDSVTSASSTIFSNPITTTASYGYPGYTYAWEYVSGSVAIDIMSPIAATTDFRAVAMGSPETRSADFRCKVTDVAGQIVYTNNVAITLERP